MKSVSLSFTSILLFASFNKCHQTTAWIRINQLGYTPKGIKIAIYCSTETETLKTFELVDALTDKKVFSSLVGQGFGGYGPFKQTYRLNFSAFNQPGHYYLKAMNARSPIFQIGKDVYKGTADFCLRYMQQQRSGFNPFLRDSCHTHDGYALYGEKAGIKDSTHIDVVGGWHDASDYLQYASTSANATYHLLMAYRDFSKAFIDEKLTDGLDGKNGVPDVLDEAKWGLNWLLKMHPKDDWMFNQVGDDRDHVGMRIPKEDSVYGKGYERPVYFVSGEPQQRGKFMNNTTGTSSTAGKFASAFALGAQVFEKDKKYSELLASKSRSALTFAYKKNGVTQTASVKSPYIYAEENWTDDMELAEVQVYNNVFTDRYAYPGSDFLVMDDVLETAYKDAKKEPVTPWMGNDTAKHYQWYPFINLGHYELTQSLVRYRQHNPKYKKYSDTIVSYYKEGIQRVWDKAKENAFFRGIPFIWCSNNLTTSFAIQCYWYRQLTADETFFELEQANFDWLFGCNPWGTGFVYGLPRRGDTPTDPHSAFTHLKNYPIDGGLVDGPVYGSIYKNLIGISIQQPDEYSEFQSDLAVYHDDYGDYSTNEPTMDGTASLIYLLAAKESDSRKESFAYDHGAIIRGDPAKTRIALVFTGDEFGEGGNFIFHVLEQQKVKASFFFTGRFYKNPARQKTIKQLKTSNSLGPHSNEHLLYCDWNNRDSLLVTRADFIKDLQANIDIMNTKGINTLKTKYFLPPYEWYNDSIAKWTKELGLQLINYTPGTLSHADYTRPGDKNYRSSDVIYRSITDFERTSPSGLNGFILLFHIGTDPKRTDKFYKRLPQLIRYLRTKGYRFQTVEQLLQK